jgi:pimeloyl-ACP methyl ester carboxylesterase
MPGTTSTTPTGARAQARATTDDRVRPFQIEFPGDSVDDLRRRVIATRWPEKETVADDSQGVPLATIQELARYWATDYDWRHCEATLNALPNFTTEIDGLDIHFIHVRSQHEDALPLIVTHGWPGSVIEQLKIVDPLTNPTAHGASAADAFHLVIPWLPGYGFSGKPTATGWDPAHTARARVELMKRLGYTHFLGQGGDWGRGGHTGDGRTGAAGAARNPFEHGWHSSRRCCSRLRPGRSTAGRPFPRREGSLRTAAQLLREACRLRADHGDAPADVVRPRGLTGRPGGVHTRPRRRYGSAWARRKSASGPSPGSAQPRRHPRQHLHVLAHKHGDFVGSLYWENKAGFFEAKNVSIPFAISVFPDELYQAPRSWAERAYPNNLIHYNRLEKGGHFAAWEQPQLFSEEMRAVFRSLR